MENDAAAILMRPPSDIRSLRSSTTLSLILFISFNPICGMLATQRKYSKYRNAPKLHGRQNVTSPYKSLSPCPPQKKQPPKDCRPILSLERTRQDISLRQPNISGFSARLFSSDIYLRKLTIFGSWTLIRYGYGEEKDKVPDRGADI